MFENQINQIRRHTDMSPKTAVVLGSGLGFLAERINVEATVNYEDIDMMPVSTAPSHKGRFVFGKANGKEVVLMQGRLHLYEGYTPQQCVFPIRLLRTLGVENIILTNAVGGINRDLSPGDLMMIKDHISCFVQSPLTGKNDDNLGERFPDMSRVYDKSLQNVIKSAAKQCDIDLKSGTYVQLSGPQFETPAEIAMLSSVGADAVGMSTVIEAIAARHCSLNVAGISLITNYACGICDTPLSSDEVEITAAKSSKQFENIVLKTIGLM